VGCCVLPTTAHLYRPILKRLKLLRKIFSDDKQNMSSACRTRTVILNLSQPRARRFKCGEGHMLLRRGRLLVCGLWGISRWRVLDV
jgi:hypothetical protein